jgi:hypothetical protein
VRLNDLGPRPADESRPVIALTPADLARAVAAGDSALVAQTEADEREALRELFEGLRARWRFEAHWPPSDTAEGTRSLERARQRHRPVSSATGRRSTYLKEFVWRWNARLSNRPMFGQLLLRAARN